MIGKISSETTDLRERRRPDLVIGGDDLRGPGLFTSVGGHKHGMPAAPQTMKPRHAAKKRALRIERQAKRRKDACRFVGAVRRQDDKTAFRRRRKPLSHFGEQRL